MTILSVWTNANLTRQVELIVQVLNLWNFTNLPQAQVGSTLKSFKALIACQHDSRVVNYDN